MAHIPDGSPYSATLANAGHPLVAVGWLDATQSFPTGLLSEKAFHSLCEHLASAWHPPYAVAGIHHCNLCQFEASTRSVFQEFEFTSTSCSELFIPTGTCIFVAPVSIAHYICAHRYLPPTDFVNALLVCPPQRSVAYLKRLLESGGRAWLAALEAPPNE